MITGLLVYLTVSGLILFVWPNNNDPRLRTVCVVCWPIILILGIVLLIAGIILLIKHVLEN